MEVIKTKTDMSEDQQLTFMKRCLMHLPIKSD